MPNIKSAIKRVSVNETKQAQNRIQKSELNTYIKKFKNLCATDVEKAKAEYSNVVSVIDSACTKGIITKANADRKKSRLAILLNKSL
ncbi:MAG: 30S ribosomal protein S20 [Christensenellales bacterium]